MTFDKNPSHGIAIFPAPRPAVTVHLSSPPYQIDKVHILLIPEQQVSVPHQSSEICKQPLTSSSRT